VCLQNGQLTSLSGTNTGGLNNVLAKYPGILINRLFSRSEQNLDNEKQKGQQMSGNELADS
jgi:hypothetical protein